MNSEVFILLMKQTGPFGVEGVIGMARNETAVRLIEVNGTRYTIIFIDNAPESLGGKGGTIITR